MAKTLLSRISQDDIQRVKLLQEVEATNDYLSGITHARNQGLKRGLNQGLELGRGPAIEPSCERFAIVKNVVPVFVKEYANRWIYMGRFKPVASYTSGDPEFERHIEGSIKSVNDISRVIILESV